MPGIVLQQLSAELVRIPADRNSGFINKGFREKAVLRVVNTAPGSERNMYRTADVANILRGNPVGDQRSLNWFVLIRIGIFPRDQPVTTVESCPKSTLYGRPVEILTDVFFTGPDQLDRTAN